MDLVEVDEFIAEADAKCPDLKPNGDKSGLINYVNFARIILDLPEENIAPPATVRKLTTRLSYLVVSNSMTYDNRRVRPERFAGSVQGH